MKMKSNKLRWIIVILFCTLYQTIAAQDYKNGPFRIEEKDKRYFLSIADSILDRDILFVNTIAKGAEFLGWQIAGQNEGRMYRGRNLRNETIQFKKRKDGKIEWINVHYKQRASRNSEPFNNAVIYSNEPGIIDVFEKQSSPKIGETVIDFTEWLEGENQLLGIDEQLKNYYRLENFQLKGSRYIRHERFPEGMDIRVSRKYLYKSGYRSFELNTTFLLLPKVPMTGRLADDRVTAMGFNTVEYTDFDVNPYYSTQQRLVYRFRLEPNKTDIPKYLKGELVEPSKPIVYYLDPFTPKDWIPFFKKGILMWNKAFEKAGFKNAIIVKEATPDEEKFNFLSARYNTLDYMPSTSFGGSADIVVDERSGEVITARIAWPHSNPDFLRNRYMVLAGAVDTGARKSQFSVALMGELNASVTAHEMGHCIGIHHNYLSSALVPVENLRDKKWVEANSFSPSIMDYSRHNYVAQPEDNIGREGLIPKLGAYDLWATEWLYRWYPDNDPNIEKDKLDVLYLKRVTEDPLIKYINIDWYLDDSRLQMEDIGDDAILATQYGLKNLKYVNKHILEWTKFPDGEYDYEVARNVFLELKYQYLEFMQHVSKIIGGQSLEINSHNSKKNNQRIPVKEQKTALYFICDELFKTPMWFLNPELTEAFTNHDPNSSPNEVLMSVQKETMEKIINQNLFVKLSKANLIDPNQYSIQEMITDLSGQVFSELEQKLPISFERQYVQTIFINQLEIIIPQLEKDPFLFNQPALIRSVLQKLKEKIDKTVIDYSDRSLVIHLQNLQKKINDINMKRETVPDQ